MEFDKLWPTVIGRGEFDSLELAQYILTNYDVDNIKGDVSEGYNIFEDNTSYINNFKKLAYNAFDEYLHETVGHKISDWKDHEVKGWITGHGKDYSMTIHNHSGAHLSGVFYVMAEDQKSGGDIVFSDPRSNANRGYDEWFDPMFQRFHHQPKTGEFMIFPSFTYHHVNPYYSNLRICIPVDLYLYRG
jgi:hypothetical protein